MEIYGLGIVAFCMYVGSFIGYFIGKTLGISGNVGGVGFAMLILILLSNYVEKNGGWSERTKNGIYLLSALYIPIVVAMAGIQNVVAAFSGGSIAFVAGGVATIGSMFLVPVIGKLGSEKTEK
ncbi:malonate transporter subunit MadL [Fusibacter ferrireducens]|uniref:Malonate transporter subunit MadL n=1 Tax=Fusibacter ferrireducens TaxID=2785058 RepID=A0ABR9ZPN5_9FIRM|nr:malonate transporter subunit MadL [Fusibacter ferrireducens]MBF4691890.1 malonate transporter subunit MadL [Fusibacter ferrireducens]